MTWSYPVHGPGRRTTRHWGCTCGATMAVTERAEDGRLSPESEAAIDTFRQHHARCPDLAVLQEAP
jgi:hypothetical protein